MKEDTMYSDYPSYQPVGPSYPNPAPAQGFQNPYPTYAGPVPSAPMPPMPVAPAPKKSRKILRTVLIVLGSLALAVAAFFTWLYFDAKGSTEPDNTKHPDQAVQGFLEALAAGDAVRALQYSATQPGDTTFLTNEAFQKAMGQATITDINVKSASAGMIKCAELSDENCLIEATYKIAGDEVQVLTTVGKYGDIWKMNSVTNTLDGTLYAEAFEGFSVTLNGMPFDTSKSYELLAGRYTFEVESEYFTPSDISFFLNWAGSTKDLPIPTMVLNDAGRQAATEATQQKLSSCLAIKELAPAGCEFSVTNTENIPLDYSTIEWSAPTGWADIQGASWSLVPGDRLLYEAILTTKIEFAGADVDGRGVHGPAALQIISAAADVSGDTVTITFDTGQD
jgi:hypothetical protein